LHDYITDYRKLTEKYEELEKKITTLEKSPKAQAKIIARLGEQIEAGVPKEENLEDDEKDDNDVIAGIKIGHVMRARGDNEKNFDRNHK
jgi:fructose-1,6-bisphosphatase